MLRGDNNFEKLILFMFTDSGNMDTIDFGCKVVGFVYLWKSLGR